MNVWLGITLGKLIMNIEGFRILNDSEICNSCRLITMM